MNGIFFPDESPSLLSVVFKQRTCFLIEKSDLSERPARRHGFAGDCIESGGDALLITTEAMVAEVPKKNQSGGGMGGMDF